MQVKLHTLHQWAKASKHSNVKLCIEAVKGLRGVLFSTMVLCLIVFFNTARSVSSQLIVRSCVIARHKAHMAAGHIYQY